MTKKKKHNKKKKGEKISYYTEKIENRTLKKKRKGKKMLKTP